MNGKRLTGARRKKTLFNLHTSAARSMRTNLISGTLVPGTQPQGCEPCPAARPLSALVATSSRLTSHEVWLKPE